MFDLTTFSVEELYGIRYNDDFWKLPTHRVAAMPTEDKTLCISQFVVYRNPLPRDYGQINAQYQRTAEPLKISLVDENDHDWRIAVVNWTMSDLFIQQPFGLNEHIRRPLTSRSHYRLHYARFLLPIEKSWREPYYDRRWSECFTAYYIGSGEDRLFISEPAIDAAYNAEPTSWNKYGHRAFTIPEDWLSNRIDENRHKYDLFA